ncbi:MAG: hypothetical protein U1E41_03585 [Paracoccus sp. (in: a-proteobacteria)]|jgi:hypothetical protein
MTLASDPFGLIAAEERTQIRPARGGALDAWRGVVRFCTEVLRDNDVPQAMTEMSWQAGFAALWDQDDSQP